MEPEGEDQISQQWNCGKAREVLGEWELGFKGEKGRQQSLIFKNGKEERSVGESWTVTIKREIGVRVYYDV